MVKNQKGKTNAMRQLDAANISYGIIHYDESDGQNDGISVARKTERQTDEIYKTLVTQSASKQYYVFLVPVEKELHLKKAAHAAGEKKIDMIAVKDLQKVTGYVKGGCSPIGMKKKYPTFLAKEASSLTAVLVSGGQVGKQIEVKVEDLLLAAEAVFADIVQE